MIWTHISFHPTLVKFFLGIQKIVIPFIKIFQVSFVYIISPFIPEIFFQYIILPQGLPYH